MKLLISTPAYEPFVWINTYRNALSMDTCGMEVECITPTGYIVTDARTKTAEEAIKREADYLLCIDSDVVVPKDALKNLLEHDVDVCFGYYTKGSGSDGKTCLYEAGRDAFDAPIYRKMLHELRDDGEYLVEVRGGGFGIVLIKTSVFDRIPEPWFDYPWKRNGRKLSEDYWFCSQCRGAGIRLYADTRVDCGHMRPKET